MNIVLPTLQNRLLPAFPCYPDKHPMTSNGFQDATTNHKKFATMVNDRPEFLLGVPTGEVTDIDVLDIDLKAIGADSYIGQNRIHILNGIQLPPTREHNTRSGGLHLLFAHHPGLRCSASKLAPGIDVRADGGYIIWWPREGFEVRNNSLLAPWPTEILDTLTTDRRKTSAMVTPNRPSVEYNKSVEWKTYQRCTNLLAIDDKGMKEVIEELEARLDENGRLGVTMPAIFTVTKFSRESMYTVQACANSFIRLSTTPKGQRNSTLNAEAYALGRLIVRMWTHPRRITVALWKGAFYNGLVNDDGFEAVIATIISGLRAGMDNPYPNLSDGRKRSEAD